MKKQLIFAIIICLLIVIAFVGYYFYNTAYKEYKYQASLIKVIDRHLSEQNRQIYQDRLNQANQKLQDSNLKDDERFNWYMQQGFQLYGLGKLAESKSSYLNAISVINNDPNAFVALFQTQLDMNDNKSAEASIKKAISLLENNPDYWIKYITLKENRLNATTNQVNSLYLEAITKTSTHPTYVDILINYAIFLEKTGNIQEALNYWQQALIQNPDGKTQYEQEITRLQAKIQ